MSRAAKAGFAVLGALVLVMAGVTAWATIPASNGTISACYIKPTSTLRVIDSTASCKKGETLLTWNEQGVPGTDGVSGYVTTRDHVRGVNTGLRAYCPAGKQIVGGGGNVSLIVNGVIKPHGAVLGASYPDIDVTGIDEDSWLVRPTKSDGTALDVDEEFDINAYAICVAVP